VLDLVRACFLSAHPDAPIHQGLQLRLLKGHVVAPLSEVLHEVLGSATDDWHDFSSVRAPYPDYVGPQLKILDVLLHLALLHVAGLPVNEDLHIVQLVVQLLREVFQRKLSRTEHTLPTGRCHQQPRSLELVIVSGCHREEPRFQQLDLSLTERADRFELDFCWDFL
jgi:hypothetical protein